ncbi:exonuclease [Staphylococcus phage vB_SauH_DELF3]|nr:exonuclease [Staphylococcus phage vB_SauH_DELF3]
MKFIFFTDSQFHLLTDCGKPDEFYRNDRFRETGESLNHVFIIARENRATIIFVGDLFHKRYAVDTVVYNEVFETFAKNQDVKVYIRRGNHDAVTNSFPTESKLDILKTLPNGKVTKDLRNDSLSAKAQLTMCAYGDETAEIKDYIEDNDSTDKVNKLVGHLGVEGSLTGTGSHRLEGAFGYQDLLPDKNDFILLGHYHERQYFQNPNDFYGGFKVQQSFSDEQESNGVLLIDTKTITLEFIPLDTRRFIAVKGDNVPDVMNDFGNQGHFIRFIGTPERAKVIELDDTEDESNVQVQMKKEYTVEKTLDADVSNYPITITSSYADKYYPEATDEHLECLKAML